ncbi:MAG TPA: TetR-like C-terminal domain-containing protein, partial [Mycobacterium sp.]|nr:TetR-like C-terminal domain-containing protein [Mycobacterium sp.]
LPDTGSLAGDVREMVRRTVTVLTTPAARAALPGLVGEMAADLTLHAALLERFGHILARGLSERLADAATRGDVRPDVTAADLAEALGGITFLALLTRGAALDDAWVERTATLILKGIGA